MSAKLKEEPRPEVSADVTEEIAIHMEERSHRLATIISQIMPIAKEAIEEGGFSSIDIAEALAVAASSTLVGCTPPEFFDLVQKQAAKNADETLKMIRTKKIGYDASMTSQVLGQSNVLAYFANVSAQELYLRLKEEQDVGIITESDTGADQPSG